jgi:hypothetical protein
MPIHFACERCGHPIDVGDQFAGLEGRCKHCGHRTRVPDRTASAPDASGLRLRALEREETGFEPDPEKDHGPLLYGVLDPDGFEAGSWWPFRMRKGAQPTTRLARFFARLLRWLRDWLYVLSIIFLALAVLGFVSKNRPLLHVGAVGVLATNLGMLVAGVVYLGSLPFTDGLTAGLAALFLPPYTIYYWVTHWRRMRKPVINTLRSFAPVFLIGLAYVFYEESPVIKRRAKEIERVIERQEKALEKLPLPIPGSSEPDDRQTPSPNEKPAGESR